MNTRRVNILVSLDIRDDEDVDIMEVVNEMIYVFDHEDIVDYEIQDVVTDLSKEQEHE